ncbi:MAG: hypothetical protein ACLQG3_14520 [Terracidiphilus sp.]
MERRLPADRTICQIAGCAVQIQRKHLMCAQHWFEVPEELRAELESSLRAWLAGHALIHRYTICRLRALIHVTQLHGGKVTNYENRLAFWIDLEAKLPPGER